MRVAGGPLADTTLSVELASGVMRHVTAPDDDVRGRSGDSCPCVVLPRRPADGVVFVLPALGTRDRFPARLVHGLIALSLPKRQLTPMRLCSSRDVKSPSSRSRTCALSDCICISYTSLYWCAFGIQFTTILSDTDGNCRLTSLSDADVIVRH